MATLTSGSGVRDTPPQSKFAFSYNRYLYPLMFGMGMGRSLSSVALVNGEMRVRFGWAFWASIPLKDITAYAPEKGYTAAGVHTMFGGAWLVNGAFSDGMVRVDIAPPARAHVLGGFPASLRCLRMSVDDRDEFLSALPGAIAAAVAAGSIPEVVTASAAGRALSDHVD